MSQDNLRELVQALARRLMADDLPNLAQVVEPELMRKFDDADPFVSIVYDDIIQALSTRPEDSAMGSQWKNDYDFIDVVIDYHLLTLTPTISATELVQIRERVRAQRPANIVDAAAYVANAVSDHRNNSPKS